MAQQAGRRNQPLDGDTGWLVIGGIVALIVMLFMMYWISGMIDPTVREAVGNPNPLMLVMAQATGAAPVTGLQIVALIGQVVIVGGLAGLIGFAWKRNRKTTTRVDDRARSMTRVKDVAELVSKLKTEAGVL